ncbi:hypothetical protein [Campylobacter lari]
MKIKKRSYKLIKNLSSNDKEFDKKIVEILEKEINALRKINETRNI